MKSIAPMGILALLILSFCSCSNPSDIAEIPEMASDFSHVAPSSKESNSSNSLTDSQPKLNVEQPAAIMTKQLEDFGSDAPTYTGDSFFETQTSFEVPVTGGITVKDEVDFSGNLMTK